MSEDAHKALLAEMQDTAEFLKCRNIETSTDPKAVAMRRNLADTMSAHIRNLPSFSMKHGKEFTKMIASTYGEFADHVQAAVDSRLEQTLVQPHGSVTHRKGAELTQVHKFPHHYLTQKDIDIMKREFGLPQDTPPQDVHDYCKTRVELWNIGDVKGGRWHSWHVAWAHYGAYQGFIAFPGI